MSLVNVERLREIAEVEFADIVAEIFPRHFHDGTEDDVSASQISQDPEEALRQFLAFVRGKIDKPSVGST